MYSFLCDCMRYIQAGKEIDQEWRKQAAGRKYLTTGCFWCVGWGFSFCLSEMAWHAFQSFCRDRQPQRGRRKRNQKSERVGRNREEDYATPHHTTTYTFRRESVLSPPSSNVVIIMIIIISAISSLLCPSPLPYIYSLSSSFLDHAFDDCESSAVRETHTHSCTSSCS